MLEEALKQAMQGRNLAECGNLSAAFVRLGDGVDKIKNTEDDTKD